MDAVAAQMTAIGVRKNARVLERASELLRIAKLKAPLVGNKKAAITALIDISCKQLNEAISMDHTALAKSCGLTLTAYRQIVTTLQRALGIPTGTNNLSSLGVKLGCCQAVIYAEQNLKNFKSNFLKSKPAASRANTDVTSNQCYIAAAFILTARKMKIRVDRASVLEACGISRSELLDACNTMQKHCSGLAVSESSLASSCSDDMSVPSLTSSSHGTSVASQDLGASRQHPSSGLTNPLVLDKKPGVGPLRESVEARLLESGGPCSSGSLETMKSRSRIDLVKKKLMPHTPTPTSASSPYSTIKKLVLNDSNKKQATQATPAVSKLRNKVEAAASPYTPPALSLSNGELIEVGDDVAVTLAFSGRKRKREHAAEEALVSQSPPAVVSYEMQRARNMMRNRQMLEQLGLGK